MAREVEAFRTFAVDTPHTAETLKAKLQQLQHGQTEQIAKGYAIDWPDYKKRTGIVQGLQMAIDECNEMTRQERE